MALYQWPKWIQLTFQFSLSLTHTQVRTHTCKPTSCPVWDCCYIQTYIHVCTHLKPVGLLRGVVAMPLDQMIVRSVQVLVQFDHQRFEEGRELSLGNFAGWRSCRALILRGNAKGENVCRWKSKLKANADWGGRKIWIVVETNILDRLSIDLSPRGVLCT